MWTIRDGGKRACEMRMRWNDDAGTRRARETGRRLTERGERSNETQRDVCTERVVRFIVTFCAWREEGMEEDADEFNEAFLGFLLNLHGAKDKAVRFRACQIIAGVLNGLGADAEVSDELYERMTDVMLERIRDKMPPVRAQAARALSRLQDGGETQDFSQDDITQAFVELLGSEKNKEVRKAILGSLAISDYTIPCVVERTRDVAEDVRRIAFLALTSKVPVESVSIAHRALVLRRGLNDRAPMVRSASVEMLKRWLEAFQGDVVKFLTALDVESNESEAALALKELITIGRIKPMDVCKDVELVSKGLKRDIDVDGLMTPEEGLYWRVVLQHLAEASAVKGANSAQSVGQAREIAVAEVGEMIEAMESALPPTAMDLLSIVSSHAKSAEGKFAARQLLPLLKCVDLNDGAIRRGAINLVAEQLHVKPVVNSHGSSYACGGDGKWESALVEIARLVANDSTEFAGLVLDAADSLQMSGTAESLTQALYIAGSLLERTSKRLPSVAAEAVMDSLIKPAVTHSTTAVRRESMRVLGLLLASQGVINPDAVVILRTALSADAAPVRCMAARALGDAALLHGPAALDKYRVLVDPEDEDVTESAFNASLPLEIALMKCLDEEGKPFVFKANAYDLEDVDVEDVDATKAAAAVEAEESVGTVAAESLCKIILRRGEGAFEAAAAVVSRLLGSYFAADAQRRPRLAQCLAVFFPALASGPEDRRRLLADCALPALRAAAKIKGLSRVAALLVQLLTASEEPTASGAELALALANESLALSTKQTPSGAQAPLAKAYTNAIARVLSVVPVKSTRDEVDVAEKVELNDTLTKAWHAAVLAAERTKEKSAAKDLAMAAERLRSNCLATQKTVAPETEGSEGIAVPADDDDLSTQMNDDVRAAVMEYAEELANGADVPFCGSKVKAAKVKAAPAVPTRESRSRASKTAAADKLKDDDLKKPLPKVTPERKSRSRRGALQETN